MRRTGTSMPDMAAASCASLTASSVSSTTSSPSTRGSETSAAAHLTYESVSATATILTP